MSRPLRTNTSSIFDPIRRRRSEEHTSELQSRQYLVCRLLLDNRVTTYIYTLSLHDALPISEVIEYFDARMIGLTATPAAFIDRDTFRVFDSRESAPTFLYTYEQAVKDKYLVNFRPYKAQKIGRAHV